LFESCFQFQEFQSSAASADEEFLEFLLEFLVLRLGLKIKSSVILFSWHSVSKLDDFGGAARELRLATCDLRVATAGEWTTLCTLYNNNSYHAV
jgi:hypothetical protein